MMMKISAWLLLLGLGMAYVAAGPDSCVGRCGETFTRGRQCSCDFGCLQHNECCQDFNAVCTSGQSCKGRCGETFRRGQPCECDPQCVHYNSCCRDFQLTCDGSVSHPPSRTLQALRTTTSEKGKSRKGRKWSNSESEEWETARGPCRRHSGAQCSRVSGLHNPHTASFSSPASPAEPTFPLYHDLGNIPVGPPPMSIPLFPAPLAGSSLLSSGVQSQGSNAPISPSGPTAHADFSSPAGSRPRPSTLQDVAEASGLSLSGGAFEGPLTGRLARGDLCSDSPISGLTALSNGTVLIFKGELFWSVDPVSRSVSHPQSVQDILGVPSHVDTVFTRCNCRGNTYVIKGDQLWLLDENLLMESGYPKPLASEFPGLTGGITAALAVPATRGRPETVYFFKKGDIMQRFIFPPGSTPSCSKRPSRLTRQPEVPLSKEINIRVFLKGFPGPVTSALSMPSPQRSAPYQHYVFSGPLFFSVKISGSMPVLADPDPSAASASLSIFSPAAAEMPDPANMAAENINPPLPLNSIPVWLGCP